MWRGEQGPRHLAALLKGVSASNAVRAPDAHQSIIGGPMQKLPLLLLLPFAVACGGANHAAPSTSPSPAPAPSLGVFETQSLGGIQLASSSATSAGSGSSSPSSGSPASSTSERPRSASGASSTSGYSDDRTESLNGRSADLFGDFVRSRSAQMNFCYKEALNTYPKLAGAINIAVTIASSGEVTRVEITKRSWSGPGTEQVEGCIRAKIRAWKFPTSEAPATTFPFTLSFTK
jgi:hypothetical protein